MKRLLALLGVPLLALGCSPDAWKTVATIADDVTKIATVLCLADHAQAANARAFSVKDACDTAAELAPYIERAKNAAPKAACAR